MDAAALLEVSALLSKEDVICLDSSGEEDEKMEPKLPAVAIRDGKILYSQDSCIFNYLQIKQDLSEH